MSQQRAKTAGQPSPSKKKKSGSGDGAVFWRRSLIAFPADANKFRDARLLHCNAVEDATGFHGLAIVGDDDELCLRTHVANKAGEAANVGFVERGIDFVQDAEWARLVAEYSDEQRERGHRLFAPREQENILETLARR